MAALAAAYGALASFLAGLSVAGAAALAGASVLVTVALVGAASALERLYTTRQAALLSTHEKEAAAYLWASTLGAGCAADILSGPYQTLTHYSDTTAAPLLHSLPRHPLEPQPPLEPDADTDPDTPFPYLEPYLGSDVMVGANSAYLARLRALFRPNRPCRVTATTAASMTRDPTTTLATPTIHPAAAGTAAAATTSGPAAAPFVTIVLFTRPSDSSKAADAESAAVADVVTPAALMGAPDTNDVHDQPYTAFLPVPPLQPACWHEAGKGLAAASSGGLLAAAGQQGRGVAGANGSIAAGGKEPAAGSASSTAAAVAAAVAAAAKAVLTVPMVLQGKLQTVASKDTAGGGAAQVLDQLL